MPNIKLFYGEEDYLIDEEIKHLKGGASSEFNFERIDGSGSDMNRIITALSSMPMLGGDRTVVIDDLEYEEGDESKLLGAINNLDPNVKVVFVFYKGIDKRRKFYKLMEKIADVSEFKRLSEWEQDKALAWIVNRVKHYGKKISGRAANLLIEIVGLSLRMLDKEIEKIATYIGNREIIEEKDVTSLASSGEMDSFALSNALREKDLPEAMMSLNRLLKDNEDPHMIVGMLAKLFRMMLQVKCLENKGLGQYEIAKELKAKPFFVKKCMEKTSFFSLNELMHDLKALHFANLRLKSGVSQRLTLEMLLPELCNGQYPNK